MKYFPRLKIFKNSTGTNTFDGKRAFSYGHYPYAYILKDGTCLATYTAYSPTTSRHVRELARVLGYAKTVFISADRMTGMTLDTAPIVDAVNKKIAEAEAKIANNRVKNKDNWKFILEQHKEQLLYVETMRLEVLENETNSI